MQIGLITHILNFSNFTDLNQLRHLVHNHFHGGGIRNLINFNAVAVLDIAPLCPQLEAAASGRIDLTGGSFVKQQLSAGGEVRSRQGLQNVVLRIFHQCNGGIANLFQVERANVTCHTDGNAQVGIDQNVGICGGQQNGFFQRSVIVIHHIHGIGVNIAEQLCADGIQLGFRITVGSIGHIAGINLTKVTL